MRKTLSIARTTALEVLSEPLSLLLLLLALVLTVFAPAFHYHQFGEATRMARDAGMSALLTCGNLLAVVGTMRTFRGEIESGTAQMALSHALSRFHFLFAKAFGVILAQAVFALIVFAVMAVVVHGAEVGARVAVLSGDIVRLWGPSLAAGVAAILLPLLVSAILNRFCACRFVLSAQAVAVGLAIVLLTMVSVVDGAMVVRYLPAGLLIVVETSVFVFAAAAFAVRFRLPVATSLVAVLFLAALPVLGNYYRAEALANGGALRAAEVAFAVLAAVPAALFFLVLGFLFIDQRDLS